MNNAQILAKSFVDLGVKKVFGFSGATILPVFHAIDEVGIEIVVNANEQSCAFAAGDAYNIFQLDDRHIGFYQVDVSGHGDQGRDGDHCTEQRGIFEAHESAWAVRMLQLKRGADARAP